MPPTKTSKRHAPTKTWKRHERKTARAFGAERVPMSGAMSSLNTHSDSFHSRIYFEAKYRKDPTLYKHYDTAVSLSVKNKKIPLCVIRKKGHRGNLFCFHVKHLQFVAENYDSDMDLFEVATIFSRKIAVWSLWEDTSEKAEFENKIPVLSIKKHFRHGFLLVLRPKDLKNVFNLYGKSDKQY